MLNRDAALLILREGDSPERHWVLENEETIIGRQEDCDIVLDSRQISRQHARIVRDQEGYTLTDLRSKNGTFVNGEPVTAARRLQDGDEIQLALVFRLGFVDTGATAPLYFETPARQGLRLDKEARMVYIQDRPLDPPLSPAQFRLLELLCDHPDRVIERDEVVRTVWPDAMEEGISEQAIDALVRRLRERLAELDAQGQYIITVRGHGFRLGRPA